MKHYTIPPKALKGAPGARRRAFVDDLVAAVGRLMRAHPDVAADTSFCNLHLCSLSGASFTVRLWEPTGPPSCFSTSDEGEPHG